jgi:hypothetical protein
MTTTGRTLGWASKPPFGLHLVCERLRNSARSPAPTAPFDRNEGSIDPTRHAQLMPQQLAGFGLPLD